MTVEFGAEITLDASSALRQMQKFSRSTKEAGETLKQLQNQAKSTAQGLGKGTFDNYINGLRKASSNTTKLIKQIHDHKGAYNKLTVEQKKVVNEMDRLNQKYDESARSAAKLKQVENELRQLVGAGLKTQKEANAILEVQAQKIRKVTEAKKQSQSAFKKSADAANAEKKAIHDLRMKYDKLYAVEQKEKRVKKDLNILLRKNLITAKEYNRILKSQKTHIEHLTSRFQRMASAQSTLAKTARLVSIYSRVLLGLYAAIRVAKFHMDFEMAAEKVGLLDQKLQFLTGDSGAYQKFFDMTQEVGINMEAANKIITRFAVVTNRAFSIETMNEWSSTLIRSARATGTSTQEMSGALIQITQAMSAGRLMGDEYRSVTENLPLLTVALRDLFGKSTLSLKELSSQGLITNKVMIEAFGKLKILLEGFPDSTDTIEAAIGRLSSAWDDFAFNFVQNPIVKDILETVTEYVRRASQFEKTNRDLEGAEEFKTATYRLRAAQLELRIQENHLNKLFEELDEKKNKNIIEIRTRQISSANKKLSELESIVADREKILRELTGNDEATRQKRIADEKIQAERELNRIFKEELKTLNLIEKIQKGKSIITVKKKAELLKNELRSKLELFDEDEAGGIDLEQFKISSDLVDKNTEESIQKIYKTKVDSYLRLHGLKTDFDLKTIQDELNNNGKLLEIQKKYELRKLQIESGMVARTIGLREGLKGEALSKFKEQLGEEMLIDLDLKMINDTELAIDQISNKIDKLGLSAEKTSATISRDKLGLLDISKTEIVRQFAQDTNTLREEFNKLDGAVHSTGKTYDQIFAKLKKAKDDKLFDAGRNLEEGLAKTFSESNKALIQQIDSTRDLNAAKELLVVTDAEYIRQLKLINEEYNHQINLTKSIHHEMIGIDQMYAGIGRGVENLTNNIETMYEMTTSATEDLIDGSIDLLVRHTESAKEAFTNLVESILIDMQKIIIKQAIINAMGGMFAGSSASPITNIGAESLGAGSTSAFDSFQLAKGGVFSGSGISKYSSSVVSKPTFFPFAKGIGIMGEDGDEAIMPLKRGRDGKLGVTVSGSHSASTATKAVSVSIENIGNNESKIVSSRATTDINGTVIKIILDDLFRGGPVRDSIKNLGEYG